MKSPKFITIVVLLIFFAGVCKAQEGFVDGVDMTTNKAPWILRILGNNLDITAVQAKPDQASAYFILASESSNMKVEVVIEPANTCRTADECRDHVLAAGASEWGKVEQLSKGKLKDFSYFEFYRPEIKENPAKMFDMWAEYVSQGYWVDVHISKAPYTKEDHALFEKVISSIELLPKTGTSKVAFDSELAKGQAGANRWLLLWDKKTCKESFDALSPIARKDYDETRFSGSCRRLHQDLGPNKSRKQIAASFVRLLKGKTDRPLAVLAYHSDFLGRPSVVEIVALVLEKDGTWVVTNYLVPGVR